MSHDEPEQLCPKIYRDAMRSYRDATSPSDPRIGRVRVKLDRALTPATALLSALPEPKPGATARIKSRLRGEPRAARPVWPIVFGATAFAMASAVALLSPQRADAPPTELALSGSGELLSLSDAVRATHDGEGHAERKGDAIHIDWEIGALTLDVDPEEGATVEVRTPEALLVVHGTRFTVERSPLGTEVRVDHGLVSWSCASSDGSMGPSQKVSASQSSLCLPLTAEGLLNRARALGVDDPSRRADALDAVQRGLSLSASGPTRVELLAFEVAAKLASGDTLAALDAAERAIAAGPDPARAIELHRTAARLSLTWGYCDRAVPHLDALPSLTPEEAAHRDRCR